MREALWLVAFGCLLGLPAVLASGDLVSKLFVGVSSRDWPIFLAVMTMHDSESAVRAAPCRRCGRSRVDPMVALREE